jgi:hypothetical protein
MNTRSPDQSAAPSRSTGLLIFEWLFVGLPLAWGVTQTIMKSLALFH